MIHTRRRFDKQSRELKDEDTPEFITYSGSQPAYTVKKARHIGGYGITGTALTVIGAASFFVFGGLLTSWSLHAIGPDHRIETQYVEHTVTDYRYDYDYALSEPPLRPPPVYIPPPPPKNPSSMPMPQDSQRPAEVPEWKKLPTLEPYTYTTDRPVDVEVAHYTLWTHVKNVVKGIIALAFSLVTGSGLYTLLQESRTMYRKLRTKFARVPSSVQLTSMRTIQWDAVRHYLCEFAREHANGRTKEQKLVKPPSGTQLWDILHDALATHTKPGEICDPVVSQFILDTNGLVDKAKLCEKKELRDLSPEITRHLNDIAQSQLPTVASMLLLEYYEREYEKADSKAKKQFEAQRVLEDARAQVRAEIEGTHHLVHDDIRQLVPAI